MTVLDYPNYTKTFKNLIPGNSTSEFLRIKMNVNIGDLVQKQLGLESILPRVLHLLEIRIQGCNNIILLVVLCVMCNILLLIITKLPRSYFAAVAKKQ